MTPSGNPGKHHEDRHLKDAQLEFKTTARRNRLLGLWAADKLGLAGEEAQAYAKEVVHADFDEPGDEDVVRKLVADFADKNVAVSDAEIRSEMVKLLGVARDQIVAEQ
ncbi:MAG: DUF1476 domain-containing protein [Rhodospirillaceae bacterium]|nr:DUF1476 domain-containing protein [Rhodospirillaceae bacterium]